MAVSQTVWEVLERRNMELGPPEATGMLTHWRYAKAEDGVVWLVLDRAEESTNTLSEAVIAELDRVISEVQGLSPRALVIRSAKKGGFVAGADIRDFRGVRDAGEVEKRMRRAHEVVDRLAGLPIPTIAVIHGHCLGGGLELALACKHRIAVDGASFGFPEVLLGLHPGLGGTFRLTSLIDPVEAMTMMLTGRTVHTKKAKALGLVDTVVEERHVENAVKAAVSGELKSATGGLRANLLGLGPARRMAAKRMRAETEKKAPRAHYPAPYRLIDLWEEHGGNERNMQRAEIRSFSQLLVGETAQNLMRVFFLREGLKRRGRGESGVKHVHVIGAGTMGGDIAAWCAARGKRVTLTDLEPKAIAAAIGRASAFYDKKLHSSLDRRDALDRLIPDFDGAGVSKADLVIEAVAEKEAVKRKVFEAVAPRMKKNAILATNTSSIPLESLRDGLAFPERFVGLHFFNPVTRMELVEIVGHDEAGEKTLQRANAFCGDISRLPASVKSAPGFLVNRALTPYLVEAFVIFDEGVPKEVIDAAAREFGMPMGPIELADRVGLDICLEVARMLQERLEEPMPDVPEWLVQKVENGETGRKAGKGLYTYDEKGRPKSDEVRVAKKAETPKADAVLADRLVLPMLNTLVRCLREGVVPDEDTADGAMIFGTGFAPFRGGPLHYARSRGTDEIVTKLQQLEEKHGPRFAPDAGWERLKGQEAPS
ncbi:3-hydroxyacyl-CoA dehydrogenase NAD-binding domain-containing protein [Chelativorans sp. M5D2P16]|uniref:3-hydroxyacyl-CoA dehydrogenase NAD-binding domain-containing protein n=1 Tax=Chelativorans sp. M5D2P16 TaxID=3095678 RepID=UPI002ACAC148|nr:3-hydroxyacyl-CoA dehydrogenase NAD-binding domain-containing protein [Chelativorans sp. M5D2P16]MDZ5696843.1 3-hydroxyacyl-CoA dehydrogenase NAD-binding domain-containing protein [Chelativorans sp. M5D2P16]